MIRSETAHKKRRREVIRRITWYRSGVGSQTDWAHSKFRQICCILLHLYPKYGSMLQYQWRQKNRGSDNVDRETISGGAHSKNTSTYSRPNTRHTVQHNCPFYHSVFSIFNTMDLQQTEETMLIFVLCNKPPTGITV